MTVETRQLREIFDKLLKHLEDSGHTTIDVEADYYWFVPRECCYDPADKPTAMTLGQLTDDWAELIRISDGQNEPLAYGCVWLASILRVVGESVPG